MSKHVTLSVPKPCHEDWNKMTPNEQGAFCSACHKTVIDFSNKTENEIFEILSKAEGKVCGRFTTMQLDRPIRKTEVNNGYMNWRAVAMSVAAFLSLGKVAAQTNAKATVVTNARHTQSKHTTTTKSTKICLRGIVVDKDVATLLLGGAKLCLGENSPVYTYSDMYGNFSMEIDTGALAMYGNMVTVTKEGYDTIQVHIIELMKGDYKVRLIQQGVLYNDRNSVYVGPISVMGSTTILWDEPVNKSITKTKVKSESYSILDGLQFTMVDNMRIPDRD